MRNDEQDFPVSICGQETELTSLLREANANRRRILILADWGIETIHWTWGTDILSISVDQSCISGTRGFATCLRKIIGYTKQQQKGFRRYLKPCLLFSHHFREDELPEIRSILHSLTHKFLFMESAMAAACGCGDISQPAPPFFLLDVNAVRSTLILPCFSGNVYSDTVTHEDHDLTSKSNMEMLIRMIKKGIDSARTEDLRIPKHVLITGEYAEKTNLAIELCQQTGFRCNVAKNAEFASLCGLAKVLTAYPKFI